MATDQSSESATPAVVHDLIGERLSQTRRNVKLVDLFTGLASLLAGILAYLLTLAVIDHWIIDLTTGMRAAALILLVLACVAFTVVRMVPPLLQTVNPIYAAHTIEQAEPSLKNSLVNLLLISRQRTAVRPVIYNGLRRQAAGELARVPLDSLVDRTPLIRAGYWLVALLALAAVYKVVSPKDPFVSVARIAAPWSAIGRPARVSILDVMPGDVQLNRGQTLEIKARVVGLRDDEKVELRFTTDDRQYVDHSIVFRPGEGQGFDTVLTTGPHGLHQSLEYAIVAGDAKTQPYRVEVIDAPHIDVTAIEYAYPEYTGLPPLRREGDADIAAIEGTRVTVHVRANQTIANAAIQLFSPSSKLTRRPATESPAAKVMSPAAVKLAELPLKSDGDVAEGRITLLLEADRITPKMGAYQLKFSTPGGQRNANPTRYLIDVTADLPPEIEILQPLKRELEVAENGQLPLEIRAVDPDFAIRQVRVVGVANGKERVRKSLLGLNSADAEDSRSGQVVKTYEFTPADHGLAAGDVILLWAEADDNRHDARGQAAPNTARTANYRIRVLAASKSTGEDTSTGEDPSDEQGGDGSKSDQPGENGEDSADPRQNGGSDDATRPSENGQGSEDNGGREQRSGEKDPGESQPGEQGSDQQNSGEQNSGEQNSGEQNSGEQGADDQGSNAGDQSAGEQGSGAGESDGSGDSQPGTGGRKDGQSSESGNNGASSGGGGFKCR